MDRNCGRRTTRRDLKLQPRAYNNDTKIYQGAEADAGEWPWMVKLIMCWEDDENGDIKIDGKNIFCGGCGGSLITTSWIVTAAHCVDGSQKWIKDQKFRDANTQIAKYGCNEAEDGEKDPQCQRSFISHVWVAPGYNKT